MPCIAICIISSFYHYQFLLLSQFRPNRLSLGLQGLSDNVSQFIVFYWFCALLSSSFILPISPAEFANSLIIPVLSKISHFGYSLAPLYSPFHSLNYHFKPFIIYFSILSPVQFSVSFNFLLPSFIVSFFPPLLSLIVSS